MEAIFKFGDRVIVAAGTYAIELADDGKTDLTPDELKPLVEAFKQI